MRIVAAAGTVTGMAHRLLRDLAFGVTFLVGATAYVVLPSPLKPGSWQDRDPDAEGPYPVVRVVDGDTLVVNARGTPTTVRLLGIDSPETVDPRRPVGCYGPQASRRAHRLLDGRLVWLRTDPSQDRTDRYGRLLAYIWTADGLVNERLVAEGDAREFTYRAPYRLRPRLLAAEAEARAARRGLWGCCPDAGNGRDPPTLRRTVVGCHPG